MIFKEPATVQAVFAAGDHAINSKKVDVKQAKAKPGKKSKNNFFILFFNYLDFFGF